MSARSHTPPPYVSTYARYVGRVGALAVALGIGAVIATGHGLGLEVARADTGSDSSGSTSGSPSGDSDKSTPAKSGGATDSASGGSTESHTTSTPASTTDKTNETDEKPNTDDTPTTEDKPKSEDTRETTSADTAEASDTTPAAEPTPTPAEGPKEPVAETVSEKKSDPAPAPAPTKASTPTPNVEPHADATPTKAPVARMSLAATQSPTPDTSGGTPAPITTMAVTTPQVSAVAPTPQLQLQPISQMVTSLVNATASFAAALLAPFFAPGPSTPAAPPTLWAVLDFVRREFQRAFFNRTPTANADEVTTSEGTPTTIDVLNNDVDDPGDVTTVASYTAAAHGALTLNTDGTFTYTPDANFSGTDSFTYTITDATSAAHLHGLAGLLFGSGDTSTATVTITVTAVQHSPTAVNDSYQTDEDTPFAVSRANGLLHNDSDVDGDTLTVQSAGPIVTAAGGTVVLAADGSFTYAPKADFNGSDSFGYTVTDGTGRTAAATATITVAAVNDRPVANPDEYTVTVGQTLAVTASNGLLHNDTDVDGDTLTVQNPGTYGTVLGNSVTVNGDGSFTYTAVSPGRDGFSYTVSDGHGGSATAFAAITATAAPVNTPPVASPDTYDATEDTPLSVSAPNGLLHNDTDADGDGDTLTIQNPGTVTTTGGGSVTVNADGSFTYTPKTDFNGADAFDYTVGDGHGGTATATATITVAAVDDPPVVNPTAPAPGSDGAVRGSLVTDPDGDNAVTITIDIPPGSGRLDIVENDGNYSYVYTPTPAAQHGAAATPGVDTDTFVITIDDGSGNTTTIPVTVTIAPKNADPVDPVVTQSNPDPVTGAVTGTVSATDTDGDTMVFSGPTSTPKGTVAVKPDGTFTYTPTDPTIDTVDSFEVTIDDGHGSATKVTVPISITAADQSPPVRGTYTASDPSATTGVVTGTVGITDVKGRPLTYTVTAPSQGTVTVNPDGTYTYTPSLVARLIAGGAGPMSDTFTVTASNGVGTATQTITITVGPATGTIVQNIGVGIKPDQLAVTSDGTRAVVINDVGAQGGTGTVSIVNLTTGTVGTVQISGAKSVLVNPTGSRAYVAGDNGLMSIDLTTKAVTPLTGAVSGMALSPDGTKLYVTHYGTSFGLGVITIATRSEALIDVPASGPITVSADGRRVYFASGNFILAMDTRPDGSLPVSGAYAATYGTAIGNPTSIALTADGSKIYVFDGVAGDLVSVDTATKAVTTVIPGGSAATTFTLSRDGKLAYLTNTTAGTVSILNTASNTVIQTISGFDSPAGVAVSADGTKLYVTNQGSTNALSVVTLTNAAAQGPILGVPTLTGSDLVTGTVTGTAGFFGGPALQYAVTTGPTQGTVALDGNGGYTYTANADARRTAGPTTVDSFTVTATDGLGRTNTVTISVPITNPVTGSATVNQLPLTAAVSPSGKLTYVVQADGTVAVVDNGSKTVVGTVTSPSGTRIQSLAVAPDGNRVYLTQYNQDQSGSVTGGALLVVDTSNPASSTYNKVVSTIPLTGTTPTAVAVSPDGARAYVLDARNGVVRVYATSNLAQQTSYNLGPAATGRTLAVSADGTRLFVVGANASTGQSVLTVVTTATGATTPVSLAAVPSAIALSPNGTQVWTSSINSGTVSVVDITDPTHPVTQTIAVGISLSNLAISPDGARVYVAEEGYDGTSPVPTFPIYAIDAATHTVIAELTIPDVSGSVIVPSALAMTPDGSRVYVLSSARIVTELTVVDVPRAGTPTTTGINPVTGAVSGSAGILDPARLPLSYAVISGPTHGTVTFDALGNYTYTPTADARHQAAADYSTVTQDSFTVTADNGQGRQVTVTVTVAIAPANAAPVGYGATIRPVSGSPTGAVKVSPLFADIDGDGIGYTVVSVAHGTWDQATETYTPDIAARLLAAKGTLTKDTITFRAVDGHGGVSTQTITVDIAPGTYSPANLRYLNDVGNGIGVVTSADGNKVYLSTNAGLKVIDIAAGTYNTIAVSNYALGDLALSPDGKTLYVAVRGTVQDDNRGGLAAVDTATGTVVGTLGLGYGQYAVAVNPNGTQVWLSQINAYPSNAPERVIRVIDTTDPTNMTVTRTVSAAQSITQIAFSPDGSVAYVLSDPPGDYNSSVTVMRTSNMAPVRNFSMGPATGLAVSPDGSKVYVAYRTGVVVINAAADPANDTATNLPVQTTSVVQVAVSPDGSVLYIGTGTGGMLLADADTGATLGWVSFGTASTGYAVYPWGLAVSADGTRLYAAGYAGRVVLSALTMSAAPVVD